MRFQPFGYGFEIRSPKPPEGVKSAIRSKKLGWFEPKTGPRGWIAGSFLCLWNSAFDRYGPMVIARIVKDGAGARVHGRAGSDLNGLIMLVLLTPFMVWLMALMIREGAFSANLLFVLLLIVFGVPAAFWFAHLEKRDADPLVRFIQRTIEPRTAKSKVPRSRTDIGAPVGRLLDEDGNDLPATEDGIRTVVEGLEVDSFVIVERASEEYMQLLSRTTDFLLEKRDGSAERHYMVVLPKGEWNDAASFDRGLNVVADLLSDYLFGRRESHLVPWELTKV